MFRKNLIKNDTIYYENNEIFNNLYRKEKIKEVNFYKTLFPVTKITIAYEALSTEFYTNKNGELYNVEKTKVKTDNSHKIWNSLYLLFPNYNKTISVTTLKKDLNTFIMIDEPTIEVILSLLDIYGLK